MEDFVSINIAKVLKEKGFNRPCVKHCINGQIYISPYSNAYNYECKETVNIPTISQVFKWLREEKDYHVSIYYNGLYGYEVICISNEAFGGAEETYDTYEEAAFDGIEYVLDNLI